MGTLGKKVQRIRSKNAGPFWITIDIFCGSKEVYQEVLKNLNKPTSFRSLKVVKNINDSNKNIPIRKKPS